MDGRVFCVLQFWHPWLWMLLSRTSPVERDCDHVNQTLFNLIRTPKMLYIFNPLFLFSFSIWSRGRWWIWNKKWHSSRTRRLLERKEKWSLSGTHQWWWNIILCLVILTPMTLNAAITNISSWKRLRSCKSNIIQFERGCNCSFNLNSFWLKIKQ
jgi:hypothetical protein